MRNFRSNKQYRGSYCLNCEHPLDLSDKYCPNCGQLNSTKKLSFDDFFNEFFAGLFAYDSRLRRTLSALLFNPGKISKDYIKGKRMRYANPFRFYLSASIIFFILWSTTKDLDAFNSNIQDEVKESEQLSQQEIEDIKKDLAKVPGIKNSNINLDSLLAKPVQANPKSYKDEYVSQKKLDSLGIFKGFVPKINLYNQFYKDTEIVRVERALDSLDHTPSTYNKWLYKKVTDVTAIQKDPGIFLNYFISKLPFIIFFYLPILALFIWLLYARRSFNYMEHLIFIFHVQTTFFVITGIALILNFIFDTELFITLTNFIFLFYLYKAMRRFYGQGRFKTIVKFILLNGIFLTLAVIAAIFSLLASFAIY